LVATLHGHNVAVSPCDYPHDVAAVPARDWAGYHRAATDVHERDRAGAAVRDRAVLDEGAVAEPLHARLQYGALTGERVHVRPDAVGVEDRRQRLARRCRVGATHRRAPRHGAGRAPEFEREHDLAHQNTIKPRESSPAASARNADLACASP